MSIAIYIIVSFIFAIVLVYKERICTNCFCVLHTLDETVWCNSSSVNETSHTLQQSNGGLKVYCPRGDQLNVRLALAGQAEYKVDTNSPSPTDTESQGINYGDL